MRDSKYVFTQARGESFKFSAAKLKELEPKLQAAYEALAGQAGTARVHPDIKAFAAAAWDEAARQLQFATSRTYAECSREAVRRSPWFYLASAAQGDFNTFDVDVQEVQS